MPDLPQLAAEVEKIVRDALVAHLSARLALNVIPHRVWVDGEAEAVRVLGDVQVESKREFRVLIIDFAGFSDTDAGCDDNPVYKLNYALKLSVSKVDARGDGSSSTDTFAWLVLELRDRCLPTLEVRHLAGYEQLTLERLRQTSNSFGRDEEDTTIFGHHATFQLSVEVHPSERS
ncbi:MAG: hypothetical protein MSG64_16680 [Pyrinomonadaceae bacterium MAG19_C2-C3]|nr:hypothetical protein [Pyrinomonadaceae bacterium MAG19_C2-C3]